MANSPPGWFQWLTDPSPLASPQFLLRWLERSPRQQRFFPRHAAFWILCLGALTPCWIHPCVLTADTTPFFLFFYFFFPWMLQIWGVLTCSAPLRQGIAHISAVLCHGTALGAAIPASSSSSVSCFYVHKRLCGPSLQTLCGVTPGLLPGVTTLRLLLIPQNHPWVFSPLCAWFLAGIPYFPPPLLSRDHFHSGLAL